MCLCRGLPVILLVLGCLLTYIQYTCVCERERVCVCVCVGSHWLCIDEAGAVIYCCWSRANNVFIRGGQRSRPHSADITPYGLDRLHTGQSAHFTLHHCMLQTHTHIFTESKMNFKTQKSNLPAENLFFSFYLLSKIMYLSVMSISVIWLFVVVVVVLLCFFILTLWSDWGVGHRRLVCVVLRSLFLCSQWAAVSNSATTEPPAFPSHGHLLDLWPLIWWNEKRVRVPRNFIPM